MALIFWALFTLWFTQTPEITPESDEITFTVAGEPDRNESLTELVRSFDELGPINSLLISQQGEMLAEVYFGRMNAVRANNIKSASKSILSLLTGIAIEKGYLDGLDQPIGEFFPEYFGANPDPVKEAITIEDLLTMRSGLASTSRANYGRWVVSNNWIRYALDRPMSGVPGIDRAYSTGNTHLLGVIIARASGMNLKQFSERYLFNPMNIRVYGWDRDPQGYYFGGNNLALRPADMVKIGQLMMNLGEWEGEQLLSGDWIIRSIEPVTGRRSGIDDYGYLWFRRMAGDHHMIYAFGNGGQYIMILPELETVITVTTRNETNEATRNYRGELFRQIDREIVPRLAGETFRVASTVD